MSPLMMCLDIVVHLLVTSLQASGDRVRVKKLTLYRFFWGHYTLALSIVPHAAPLTALEYVNEI